MVNPNTLNNLFKPYEIERVTFQDFLDVIGCTLKEFLKIRLERECSKSMNDSCINTGCHNNFIQFHDDDLYKEVIQEILEDRKKLKERIEKERKKYGYI